MFWQIAGIQYEIIFISSSLTAIVTSDTFTEDTKAKPPYYGEYFIHSIRSV